MSDRKEFYLNISPRDLRRSPEEKALGRSLGSMGRTLKATTVVFNPNAWDGDNDGLVQDSTPFERPAIPGVNDFFTRGVVDADKATEAWRLALEQRRAPGSGARSAPRPSDGIASVEDAIAKIRKHRTIDYKYGDDSILGKPLRAYDPSWLDGLSPKQISQLVVPSSEDDLYELLLDYNIGKDYGDGLRKAAALRLLKRAYKKENEEDGEVDFSPESVQQMREIVEKCLEASPAFLYSVQKFGMPAILKHKDKEDSELIAEADMRFGQIYLYPDIINNDLYPVLPNDESIKGNYIVDRSILSTLTHEYAHFLHSQVIAYDELGTASIGKIDRQQMRAMVQIARKYEGDSAFRAIDPDSEELPDMASMPELPLVKSMYSHTNKEETFAEGFSAFMHPNADIRENSINYVMRRDLEAFLDQRIMPRDDQSTARISSSGRRDRRVNAGNQRLEMVRTEPRKESDNSRKLARRLEIETSGINSSLLLENPNAKAPSTPRLSSAGTNMKRDLSRGSIKEPLRNVEITKPHLSHVDDTAGRDELRLIADVHQIGDEKIIFGYFTKTQKKNMSVDGVKIVPINPYEISGYEQTSEEGRRLARIWAFARAYDHQQNIEKGKYGSKSTDVEALLYAASRGDSEAMEKLEEMASIAEEAVAKRRADTIAENADAARDREEYLQRAAKQRKLDDLTIDGLMLVHETRYPPRYDEDGNIILNPTGDWPNIPVGEGTNWDEQFANSDDGGFYYPRQTLHFHLNGLAEGHMLRPRQGGYIIIVPLRQVLDANPGSLDNLFVIDTWLTPKPGEPLRIPGARVLDQSNLPTYGDLDMANYDPDEKSSPDIAVHAVIKELGGQPFSGGEFSSEPGQDYPVFKIAQDLGVTSMGHTGTYVHTKEKQVRPVDSAPLRQKTEPDNTLSISYGELSQASDNQILRIANDDRFTGYRLQYEMRGDDLFLASRGARRERPGITEKRRAASREFTKQILDEAKTVTGGKLDLDAKPSQDEIDRAIGSLVRNLEAVKQDALRDIKLPESTIKFIQDNVKDGTLFIDSHGIPGTPEQISVIRMGIQQENPEAWPRGNGGSAAMPPNIALEITKQIHLARGDDEAARKVDEFREYLRNATPEQLDIDMREASSAYGKSIDRRVLVQTRSVSPFVSGQTAILTHHDVDERELAGIQSMSHMGNDITTEARKKAEFNLLGIPMDDRPETRAIRPSSGYVVSGKASKTRVSQLRELYGDDVEIMVDAPIGRGATELSTKIKGKYGSATFVLRPEVAERTRLYNFDTVEGASSRPEPVRLSTVEQEGAYFGNPLGILYDYKTGDTLPTPAGGFESSIDDGSGRSAGRAYKEALVLGRFKPEEVEVIYAPLGDLRNGEIGELGIAGISESAPQNLSLLIDAARTRDRLYDQYGIEVVPQMGNGLLSEDEVELFNPSMTGAWFDRNFPDRDDRSEIISDDLITPYEAWLKMKLKDIKSGKIKPEWIEYRGPDGVGDDEKNASRIKQLEDELGRIASRRSIDERPSLASSGRERNIGSGRNDTGPFRLTRGKGYGDQADRVALFSGKKYQEIVDRQPPLNSEQKNTASEIKSIVSTPALRDVDLYDVSTDVFGQEKTTLLDSEERIEAKKKIRAAVTNLFTNTLELDKPLIVRTEDGEEISLGKKIRITPRRDYSALTGNGVKIDEAGSESIRDQAAEMFFDPLLIDETTKIMSISINFSIDIPEDETLEFDVRNLPVSHPLHRYKKTEYDEQFRLQTTNTLKIGTGTRTLIGEIDKDGNFQITAVLHDSLVIDKGLKGGGIGTIINAKNETIYKELGAKRILTQGLSSNDLSFGNSGDPWSGASHWPKNGFTWAGERGKQEFIAIIHDAITNNSGKYFAPGEKEKISELYTFDEATGTFTTNATPEELLRFKYSTELFMDKNASIYYERRLTSGSQSGMANNSSGIAKDMDLDPSLSRVGLKSSGRRVPKNVKRDLVAGSLSKKSETVSGDKYTASIYSVEGKKIAFGIRDREAAGIPDDVEVITMNPYIISGHEQTSVEGREFAYKWAMAKSAAMYGDDERITPEMKENRATHVDALLYAASRGDSSAMEELEMLSSIGEKMAQEERRRFKAEELEPQKKMWSRELSDLTEEEQLALPSIDDIYVIHQTVHPIVKDENGDIVIRPNGDWQHEKPDGSEAESFRDSVHFAINHVVSGHMFRERPETSNIIVVPLREFLAANPDSVDGVNTVDTWATPKPGEPIKIPTATSKVFENVKAEKGEQKNGEADTLVEDYLRGEALKRTRERHKNEMIEQWRRDGLSDERIEILSDPGNLKYERTESGLSYNYVPKHTYLDSTPESAGTDRFNAYLKQMMLEQYGVVWMMPHMGSPQEILEDATAKDTLESETNSGVFSPKVLGRVSRNQILRIGDSGRLHGVSKVVKERTQSVLDDDDDDE